MAAAGHASGKEKDRSLEIVGKAGDGEIEF
jgi:hypothetical protein